MIEGLVGFDELVEKNGNIMIYAFTGKTGSGKTFRMVALAWKAWCRGTDIYSNTILKFEELDAKRLYTKLFKILFRRTPQRGRITYFEDISEILEARNGLILFDEAQVLFNAREWESLPSEFQYKLQQHRKHRLDLLCTTQSMGAVDLTYRRLVQYWYHHKRIFQIGKNKSLFGLYLWEQKDVDELYTKVDDLVVTTVRWRPFFITTFSRTLYDTFYDIGFKRFKIIWITTHNKTTNLMRWYIVPKKIQLNNVLRVISSLKALGSGQLKSASSKRS